MKSFADILKEEGMEKGEQKNNRKIIRNAIKAGLDIDTITQITGLSKKRS